MAQPDPAMIVSRRPVVARTELPFPAARLAAGRILLAQVRMPPENSTTPTSAATTIEPTIPSHSL